MMTLKLRSLLVFLFCFMTAAPAFAAEHAWELKKDEDGIKVYTRKVDGSPIREFKAVMMVNVRHETAALFHEDEKRYPTWFDECLEARMLEDKDGVALIYYVMNMPWPVQNRDSVFHRKKVIGEDGSIFYNLSALPDAYPRQSGKIRVPYLKAGWQFKPLSGGKTEVMFHHHADPGGRIPSAVVNALIIKMPFNTFRNMRALLEDPETELKYRPAPGIVEAI